MAKKPLGRGVGFRVLSALVLALVVYLTLALWGGWGAITEHLCLYPLKWFWAALALSTFNFLVRFLRYHLLLRWAGVVVPWMRNLLIHFAGLALTMTPGKVGEAIKSWFLYVEGYPPEQTLPTVFMERLTDLLAVLLLASLGVVVYGDGWLVLGIALGLIALMFFSFFSPTGVRLLTGLARRIPPLRRREAQLEIFFGMLRSYGRSRPMALSLLVGVVGWGAEALAFALVARGAGFSPSLLQATFIYSISTLAGVVFPGGLGGMEGMMGLLLAPMGSRGAVVAVVFLIRFATLWWATLLGLVALLWATLHYTKRPTTPPPCT